MEWDRTEVRWIGGMYREGGKGWKERGWRALGMVWVEGRG